MSEVSPDRVRHAVEGLRGWADELFGALEAGSRGDPGIMRDTYGPGENFAHALLADHAVRAGLDVRSDAAGNTFMTRPGLDRSAPAILMGSHLDSVPHGGNFDGAAGVLAGLIASAALPELGIVPACDVTVMAIRAEESVWFEVSYIGSRSALGTLQEGALDRRRVDTGRTLRQHMAECGCDPAAIERGERSLDPARVRAFLELHIEQAPGLLEAGHPVGIATGIPGNVRYPNARITGRYDHVGTPRRFRRDAAMAGAEFAARLDRLWQQREAAGIPMAITLGRFGTDPAQHGLTTVAGRFDFSLDVRAYDEAVLADLDRDVREAADAIARERNVAFALGARASAKVGLVSPTIRAGLTHNAERLGVSTMPIGSPASHDAAAFAAAGIPVGMIFVRNEHGSHNPDEAMTIDDFLDGTCVMAGWLAAMAEAAPDKVSPFPHDRVTVQPDAAASTIGTDALSTDCHRGCCGAVCGGGTDRLNRNVVPRNTIEIRFWLRCNKRSGNRLLIIRSRRNGESRRSCDRPRHRWSVSAWTGRPYWMRPRAARLPDAPLRERRAAPSADRRSAYSTW